MNDRIFDLLYRLEQREIVEKLRHNQSLYRDMPASDSASQSIRQWVQRIWQWLFSTVVKERKDSVGDERQVKTAARIADTSIIMGTDSSGSFVDRIRTGRGKQGSNCIDTSRHSTIEQHRERWR